MKEHVKAYLEKAGYAVNTVAADILWKADDWYRIRETDDHRRVTVSGERYSLARMGFAKRAAADDANLCEVVEINAGSNDGAVHEILAANRFDTQYREQLELTSAEGTSACYVRLEDAEVNSIDGMQGYGYPKVYGAIPVFLGLDAAFSALLDDVDTAEKITLINERICGFDEKGQPIAPNEAMKRRFVFLGDKLPQAGDLIHETSPQIRIDMFRPTIEFLLSLMSLKFGYGTKKYSFDASGVVQTATQYIGERQDMMQELNRQRFQAKQYIRGIIRAALWFSNTFCGTACDLDEEIRIEFDDSYIEGKTERLEGMRQDALAGLGGVHVRARYLAAKYNLEEDEALAWAQSADEDYAEGSENDFPTAQNIPRRR